MTSARQMAAALYGVWLLYKFDRRAWGFFDKTPQGFWNAFVVAVALSPLQIGLAVIEYDADKQSLDVLPYLVVKVLSYILTWTLFPFAMLYVARLLGREHRYLWYMVPYIWMQLPLAVPLFSVQLLTELHVLPPAILGILGPAVLLTFAVYGTFVAGIGLQIVTGTAVGLVVLDYVLGLLADRLISLI